MIWPRGHMGLEALTSLRCTAGLATLGLVTHRRLRPRHPLHDGLVWSRRLPSSRTRRNQYDATGALGCARRHNNVTRCNGIGICLHMAHAC